MFKQNYQIKLALLYFVFLSHSTLVAAEEHVLIPKFGVVERIDNTNHQVDNNTFDFDDDVVAAPGFMYLYKMDTGFAFGAEVFGYENEIIASDNNDGYITSGHVYGIIEKYFNRHGTVQPFIGIGLGFVSVNFDANINGEISDDFEDSAIGLSYEFFAGAEFIISDSIGLILEYKYFDFNIDDDIEDRNIEIESDGRALFVGVAIHL